VEGDRGLQKQGRSGSRCCSFMSVLIIMHQFVSIQACLPRLFILLFCSMSLFVLGRKGTMTLFTMVGNLGSPLVIVYVCEYVKAQCVACVCVGIYSLFFGDSQCLRG
jgi:hypothetical protein